MAKFTLTCKVKDGSPQTQLIPEEATLLCKSSDDTESKVSPPSNSKPLLEGRNHWESLVVTSALVSRISPFPLQGPFGIGLKYQKI